MRSSHPYSILHVLPICFRNYYILFEVDIYDLF